jgi:hypothetical protein
MAACGAQASSWLQTGGSVVTRFGLGLRWRAVFFVLLPVLLVWPAASEAGTQWRTPITLSGAGGFSPRIDVDAQGNAIAVWVEPYISTPPTSYNRIKAAVRPKDGSFGAAQFVSPDLVNALEPRVAVDKNGNALVIWTEDVPSPGFDRVKSSYRPAGGSFGAVQTISADGANAFNPDVAFDDDGNATAIWARGINIETSFRPVGGASVFGPVTTLSTNSGTSYAYEPRVAGEDSGKAVAVWTRFDGGLNELRVQVAERKQPAYMVPGSANSLNVSLVPVMKQCGTGGNPAIAKHAPPMAIGSCTGVVTTGTAHVGANNVSSASITVVPGNFLTAANEADIQYVVSATDVRSTSKTGPDYNPNASGPDLTFDARLRITDSRNGTGQTDAATMVDIGFGVPVDCVVTGGSDGSNCNVNTTANAVNPGSIVEGKDMVIQAFRYFLKDSGPNGIRGDVDDKLFEQQGWFSP